MVYVVGDTERFFFPIKPAMNGMWLQQGGATCQTTRVTLTLLQTKFPGRIIFQKGDLDGIFFYGAIRRNQLRLQKSKKTSDMQLLN